MLRILILSLLFVSTQFLSEAQSFTPLSALQGVLRFAEVNEANGVAIVGGIETYKSIDNGFTWTEFNDDFSNTLYSYETYAGVILGANSYCLLGRNVFNNTYAVLRTTDAGISWTTPLISTSSPTPKYLDIDYNGTALIISAEGGVYTSITGGATWSFTAISAGTQISPFVQHNTLTNDWITGRYMTDFSTSSNNGNTWNAQSISPYFSGGVVNSSNQNSGVLFTDTTASESRFVSLNATYSLLDSVHINNQYFAGGIPAKHAFYLSNGDLFIHNNTRFYSIDTSNNYVFYHDHQLINNTSQFTYANDIDIDQTYGIAVGNGGAISRINLTQPPTLYVPANFSIQSAATCPGDPIVASADYPFADSIQWFYDGTYISNDSLLNYSTPLQFGTFNLEMRSWKNGAYVSTFQSISLPAPLNPLPFSTNFNALQCYGADAQISFYALTSSNTSTYIEVWLDGNNFYPAQLLGTSNFSISTPPLMTGNDTLMIISSRPQFCGTTYDTLIIIFSVDANPYQYILIEPDSVQCQASSYTYQFLNTIDINTYTLTQNFTVSVTPVITTVQGNSTDTITFTVTAPTINNSMPLVYQGFDLYNYYELSIDGNYGCTYNDFYFDTVRVQRSTALIYPGSRSFYNSDTIEVFNPFPWPNRTWSIDNFPAGDISNVNDTVPLIYTDTTGFFNLKLLNEPIPGCVDSEETLIHICDATPIDSTSVCSTNDITSGQRINQIKLDQYGNTYFSGTKKNFQSNSYFFVKYAPDGTFLWRKNAPNAQSMNSATSLEGFDFDSEGNVYVGVWIEDDESNSTIYGSLTNTTNSTLGRSYVAKVNKDTGNPIWIADIGQFPGFTSNSIKRLTDLVVSEDKVYFAINENGSYFRVLAIDLNGNFISGSPSYITSAMMGGYTETNYIIGSGSCGDSRRSYFSPQLEALSTGEIVGLVEYRPSSVLPPATLPQLNTNADVASFAFKYTIVDGIHDITRVAERGNTSSCISTSYPYIQIDNDDNITFAFNFVTNNPLNPILSFFNTPIDINGGTIICQTDSDFNVKWHATSQNWVSGLTVAKQTGQIHAIQKGGKNVSIGIDTTNIMYGGYDNYSTEYGTSAYDWDVATLQTNHYGFYTWTLSQDGVPERMSHVKLYQANGIFPSATTTPCGDLRVFLNNGSTNPTGTLYANAGGVTYPFNECIEIRFGEPCPNPTCSYLTLPDSSVYCANDSSIQIPILDLYNIDSAFYEIYSNGSLVESGWKLTDSTVLEFQVPPGVTNDFDIYIANDTVNVLLLPITTIVTDQPSYYVGCTSTLIIGFNNTSFTSANWLLNGVGSANFFNSTNLQSGSNTVTLQVEEANGCTQSMDIEVSFCAADLIENQLSGIKIWPNPNTGTFHVEFSELKSTVKLLLSDLNGKAILSQTTYDSSEMSISEQLPSGCYFLELLVDGSMHRSLIIVQ